MIYDKDELASVSYDNPYGIISSESIDHSELNQTNQTIKIDGNVMIDLDGEIIKAKDLFRKLDILDKIIKQHYPEELLI